MSNDDKYREEFSKTDNAKSTHKGSWTYEMLEEGYILGRKHSEAEIENLRFIKSCQSDIIDRKSALIQDHNKRITELSVLARDSKQYNEKLKELLKTAKLYFVECTYPTDTEKEWLRQYDELMGEGV